MKGWELVTCVTITILVVFAGCIQQTQPMTIHINDNGNTGYATIQDAINAAPNGSIIYINSGTYYENIAINKTITLIGENITTTIIDGNGTADVIYISETGKANIGGFTIRNSDNAGISIHSNNNTITGNNISNNKYGIFSTHSQYNIFSQNTLLSNSEYGMYLYPSSDNNMIFDNIFSDNICGLHIKDSKHNEVSRNMFMDNQKGVYFCCGSQYNTVFHNVFMNNSIWNAHDFIGGNRWDNGRIGNYWDDYNGTDADGDEIGDISYTVSSKGQDNHPLMNREYKGKQTGYIPPIRKP